MHRHIGTRILFGLGLAAGAGLLMRRMAGHRHCMAAGPVGPGDRHGWHRTWAKGYPPFFEDWHRQAHAREQAQPAAKAQPAAQDQPPAAPPA